MGKQKKKQSKAPKPQVILRQNTPLLWLMSLGLLLSGLYHLAFAFAFGTVVLWSLSLSIHSTGFLRLPPKQHGIPWCLLGLGHLFALPFALNPGQAWGGLFRLAIAFFFSLLLLYYSQEERRWLLDCLATMASILSGLCCLAYAWDSLALRSNLNGRLDGLFQYANSWGLYLLCFFAWILLRDRQKHKWLALSSLALGIFLTGSRTVLIVWLGLLCYLLCRKKLHFSKKTYLFATGAFVALLLLANQLMGGLLLWRLGSSFLESSSVNGRLLYALDAVKMLWEHPMGLGRGGYLYLQPLYQTGVYITHYVHNEYLQMALEGGILGGLGFLWLVFSLWKHSPQPEKLMVALMALHIALDFDTQYLWLFWLLLLWGAPQEYRSLSLPSLPQKLLTGVFSLVFVGFSWVYFLDFHGYHQKTYELYPWDVSLAETHLQHAEDKLPLAQDILARSAYSPLAWDAVATYAQGEEQLYARYRHLELSPYREESYRELLALLERQQALFPQVAQELAQEASLLLERTQSNTSPLAYRIYDKADFSWAEEIHRDFQRIGDVYD